VRGQRPDRRLTILDLLLLIVGVAVGLWLFADGIRSSQAGEERAAAIVVAVLGGLSVVGPPLLLWRRYRIRARLRLGELLWFCQGTASWLLWPPIVAHRIRGGPGGDSMAAICYFYGTPLMALFVTTSLLAGGWIHPRRGRHRRPWREVFGLLLALAWACTGLYILSVIYRKDLS
jgi:hypothetical protein